MQLQKSNQKHRTPTKPRSLDNIPNFVLPEYRDHLITNLEATQMFLDAGINIGNTKVYQAIVRYKFTFYIIKSQYYLVKPEILAAIKKWPRDVPREQGYYPSIYRQKRLVSNKTPKRDVNPIAFTYYISVA
jgi:hypothetical protein